MPTGGAKKIDTAAAGTTAGTTAAVPRKRRQYAASGSPKRRQLLPFAFPSWPRSTPSCRPAVHIPALHPIEIPVRVHLQVQLYKCGRQQNREGRCQPGPTHARHTQSTSTAVSHCSWALNNIFDPYLSCLLPADLAPFYFDGMPRRYQCPPCPYILNPPPLAFLLAADAPAPIPYAQR